MNEKRVCIIIDGSNFYHRLKELEFSHILTFDYAEFAKHLVGHHKITVKRYYIGAVREEPGNEKSKQLMIFQLKLFARLNDSDWEIRLGHLLKSERFREKGVDVMMVVDLLVGAYEDSYDHVILVSSDTDLIPALQKIRSMGKTLEYIGFRHKPSYGLMKNADGRMLLTREDAARFIPDSLSDSSATQILL